MAYLNLDEVIRIIREEDEVKPTLMSTFDLSDVQAEAILNMRLRSLRKLEEMEIRKEEKALQAERSELKSLLKSDQQKWEAVAESIQGIKEDFGPKTAIGKRRTDLSEAPEAQVVPMEAMIEKEPITVLCSRMGWLRAMKGHMAPEDEIKYKEGDEERFRFHAQTTDKLLIFASNGRFYTIGADRLAGGRGFGEPIRLMLHLDNDEDIVGLFPHRPGDKVIVASSAGKGFIAEADNLLAQTRQGKLVMNLPKGVRAKVCLLAEGDHVAVMGGEKKLLIFPTQELTALSRGQGVVLQKYKKGGLFDVKCFNLAEGLSWTMGGAQGRIRTEFELDMWLGKRGNVGRILPRGFPNRKSFD